MRLRRGITLAMGVVFCTSLVVANATAAQPAPTDPELFDLGLAQAQLDEIRSKITRYQNDLADILEAIDGLTIERDFIELNDQGRNDLLQQSRTQARNMAINAYIGIGPPLSSTVVLDAETANDLSFRNGLLRQQAERLQWAAETYSLLAGEVDADVLRLSDAINDQIRKTEALSRSIARESAKIPHAEWVVSIAAIHHEADLEFAKRARREPTSEQWRQLRFCESTEIYDIDVANGFFGAYQFEQETWQNMGGVGSPADAPAAEQDARARLLYALEGRQPWPVCGRFLPA